MVNAYIYLHHEIGLATLLHGRDISDDAAVAVAA